MNCDDFMSIISVIEDCGRNREMVLIVYEGHQRFVEAYSFRNGKTLFYEWCHLRNSIRSFTTAKIIFALLLE